MNKSFWARVKGLFNWRTALFFSLMFIMLGALSGSISAVVPHLKWDYLITFSIYGLILSWVLGYDQVRGEWAAVVGIVGGFLLGLFYAGSLQQPFVQFLKVGLSFIWDWVRGQDLNQLNILQRVGARFATQSRSVIVALWGWIVNLRSGSPTYSFLASRFLWGVAVWSISYWMGWSMRRYFKPLWGFLPVSTLVGILLTYTPGTRYYLLVFTLGAGLAFTGLGFYEEKKSRWNQLGIPYYARVERQLTWITILVSIAVMIFAGSVPSLSIQAISDPIQEWRQERGGDDAFMESLGVEFQPGPPVGRLAKVTQLPRSHLIGSGPELEENVVMVVSVPGDRNDLSQLPKETRYWRAYTYDQYTGLGWTSSNTVERRYAPGQLINDSQPENTSSIVQEFRLSQKIVGPLYTSGTPLSVNREYQAFWRTTSQDPDTDDQDLVLDDMFAAAVNSDYYQVESTIPMADQETLRAATGRPPDWIQERYIDLPKGTPFRVIEFAVELTEDEPTKYDKAQKIEAYLRSFEYTLDLPSPPQEGDLVDYFLFDLKKGYCDYYATSMVVMARAVGIPARLVVGYVDGTYDPEGRRFLVTEADAHSWPELYFSGVGWVPFEPTAQRSVIERVNKNLPVPPELQDPPEVDGQQGGLAGTIGKILGGILLFGFVASVVYVIWINPWLMQRRKPTQTMQEIFHRLYRFGRWFQLDLKRPATPYQFSGVLNQRLSQLQDQHIRSWIYRDVSQKLTALTEKYVALYYGPQSKDTTRVQEMVLIWKFLRWQLLAALGIFLSQKVKQRIQSFFPFIDKNTVE